MILQLLLTKDLNTCFLQFPVSASLRTLLILFDSGLKETFNEAFARFRVQVQVMSDFHGILLLETLYVKFLGYTTICTAQAVGIRNVQPASQEAGELR
jgi:hypothetical protein